jgi:hypothetical protein
MFSHAPEPGKAVQEQLRDLGVSGSDEEDIKLSDLKSLATSAAAQAPLGTKLSDLKSSATAPASPAAADTKKKKKKVHVILSSDDEENTELSPAKAATAATEATEAVEYQCSWGKMCVCAAYPAGGKCHVATCTNVSHHLCAMGSAHYQDRHKEDGEGRMGANACSCPLHCLLCNHIAAAAPETAAEEEGEAPAPETAAEEEGEAPAHETAAEEKEEAPVSAAVESEQAAEEGAFDISSVLLTLQSGLLLPTKDPGVDDVQRFVRYCDDFHQRVRGTVKAGGKHTEDSIAAAAAARVNEKDQTKKVLVSLPHPPTRPLTHPPARSRTHPPIRAPGYLG